MSFAVDVPVRPLDALEAIAASAGPLRQAVAGIAERFVLVRGWETLGFVRLSDCAIERFGVSGRELQELARVGGALRELPLVDDALASGVLSWTHVRSLCRVVRPEDQAWWLALAQRSSASELAKRVRAVERAARGDPEAVAPVDEPRALLRVGCEPRVAAKYGRVCQLARRVAGAWISRADVAERVAAEVSAELGLWLDAPVDPDRAEPGRTCVEPGESSPAMRRRAWPVADCPELAELLAGVEEADAFELERRLRRAIALEQSLLCRLGAALVAVADAKLFRSLGFTGLDGYAQERLGLSARKARQLLRVERAARRSPPLHRAWHGGALSWSQAQLLASVVWDERSRGCHEAWVERARKVTVRRLEDDVEHAFATECFDVARLPALPAPMEGVGPEGLQVGARARESRWHRSGVSIAGPLEVVKLFRSCLARVRLHLERLRGRSVGDAEGIEWMCDHVLDEWTRGERSLSARERRAHRTFVRDGWRCTVPGCRSVANLHSHHIRFRSQNGSDEEENRTTLCAAHHQRQLHQQGRLRITGRAPDRLRFELPLGAWRSGDFAC